VDKINFTLESKHAFVKERNLDRACSFRYFSSKGFSFSPSDLISRKEKILLCYLSGSAVEKTANIV